MVQVMAKKHSDQLWAPFSEQMSQTLWRVVEHEPPGILILMKAMNMMNTKWSKLAVSAPGFSRAGGQDDGS